MDTKFEATSVGRRMVERPYFWNDNGKGVSNKKHDHDSLFIGTLVRYIHWA